MDLELVKFMNSDLTWNAIKKGHRSMIRRPKRHGASSSELGFCSGNNMQDSLVLDYEKSGIAILGQHFAEEILEVPLKKRILILQSPSLHGEEAQSPQPQTHSALCEGPELLVGSKHASGESCRSSSPSNIWTMKSKSGLGNSEHAKLIEKDISALTDFSGIELLAAAACHSSVNDHNDHLELSAMEEHTQARVDSSVDDIKVDTIPLDSDDSSVQDDTFPATQNLCDDGSGRGDDRHVPSKGVRLHWDLNTMMDEWEEPSCDIHVDPHSERSYLRDVHCDDLQSSKANLEGYETRIFPATGGEQESILHSVCVDQSGKHEAAVSIGPLSKLEIFGIQENNEDHSFGRTYVAEDIASSKEVAGAITCKTPDAETCLSKSDVVDSFVPPASASTVSLQLSESDINFEPANKSDDRQAVSEVLQVGCLSPKGNGDDKVTSDDCHGDCRLSVVPQYEQGHMAEGNTTDKVKAVYDSPVEDGELREPVRSPWQTNEVEERVCVDYESDNTYEDHFDTIESVKNEITLDHCQHIGALGAVSMNAIEQDYKVDTSNVSNHLLGSNASAYQLQKHSQCDILEKKNDDFGKFLPVRKMEHDEFHGQNLSSNDRSVSFGVYREGAFACQNRFDNDGDSYSQRERDFGTKKLMGRDGPFNRGRARNVASGPWGDSTIETWDSRNNHGYPRPRNVIGVSMRSGGSSSLDKNQAINYNSRGIYRTFNTRSSSSDRNESYGVHRGTSPVRDINHDRGRHGSGFYLQGLRRAPAPQEEYNDPKPCYLERKASCFSPSFNQGAHLSRTRRPSRSRSGSPIAWHFLKRRNVDTKRQSPDYRSDTRFDRDRFPFRQPGSSCEIEAGLVPLTSDRASPQCISRKFDDRNAVNGQYRDRRLSPVRMDQQNQRFEAGEFVGRLKSNDHFRPTPRPGRFPQATVTHREEFEFNRKDRMIHADKCRMMNGGRSFRYPVDESNKTHNTRDKDNGYRYARDENRFFKGHIGRDVHENTSGVKHY